MYNYYNEKRVANSGFTIVELLVVIVIIGILSSITIVSYVGVTNLAKEAAIGSDYSSATKQLEIFRASSDDEVYPQTTDCSLPNSDDNLCVDASDGSSFAYIPSNDRKSYSLYIIDSSGSIYGIISGSASPVLIATNATVPVLSSPQSVQISSSSATLGADIVSNGGIDLTAKGICWGTTPNPTANCSESIVGRLAKIGLVATSYSNPRYIAVTGDGGALFSSDITSFSRDSNGTLSHAHHDGAPGGPNGNALSHDGKFFYQTSGFNSVFVYSRNMTNNTFGYINFSETGGNPYNVAISPDDNYLYTANQISADISVFLRNKSLGTLTLIDTVSTDAGPYDIVISSDGESLYTASNTNAVAVFDRNVGDGTISYAGSASSSGVIPFSMKVSNDGNNLYVANLGGGLSIFDRNTTTGMLSNERLINDRASQTPMVVVVSSDDMSVYVVNNANSTVSVYDRNQNNGNLTYVNSLTAGNNSMGLAISGDGKSVYVSNYSSSDIAQYYRENGLNGIGNLWQYVSGMPAGTQIYYRGYATNILGRAYSPDGTFTTQP